MTELTQLLGILIADIEADSPVALCVVLKKHGSAPQVPGATMLVRSDGSTIGTVGGGAVEAEVRRRALELLRDDRSVILGLSLEDDYGWDDAPICGGSMTVGVMPVTRATDIAPFRAALDNARARKSAHVPIVVEHQGKRLEYRLHLEVPPTLLIAGAGHVGQAVARLGVDLGFHTVVIDDRPDMASQERFPEGVELIVDKIAGALRDYPIDTSCYVVIATRGHKHDHDALAAVIDRPAGYIGMIGSQRKSAAILSTLADAGVSQYLLDRVHTPIGMSIGALTVSEIAVSIAGELIQTRRQTTPEVVEGPIELS